MSLADPYARRSELKMFIRSVLPSTGSFVGCLLGSLVLIGVHALFIALNDSAATFPYVFDGDPVSQAYNMYIVLPLGNMLHSNIVNTLLVVLLWAIPAWLLFELASHALANLSSWRATKRNITLPQGSDGLATPAPLQHSFTIRLAWQGAVLIIGLIVTIICVQVLHFILLNDRHVVQSGAVLETIRAVAVSLGLWMLLLHIYVVLLRWYMARTRVFGEILY
jgi:hypothetical protein